MRKGQRLCTCQRLTMRDARSMRSSLARRNILSSLKDCGSTCSPVAVTMAEKTISNGMQVKTSRANCQIGGAQRREADEQGWRMHGFKSIG